MRSRRLSLRLLEVDGVGDQALYVHLYTDPAVMRRIAIATSPERAMRAFQSVCRHNQRDVPGHRAWRIDWHGDDGLTKDAEGVGIVALMRAGGAAELGVMLRDGWWSRGVSSEAFTLVLAHAFGPMGLTLVHAERPDDDHALIIDRLLARFAFRRVPERASAADQCRWELPLGDWDGVAPRP